MSEATGNLLKGGSFLLEDIDASHYFAPEDFTEEQLMIARTTEDFIEKDVKPYVDAIENHEFQHTTRLLKKQASLAYSERMCQKNMVVLG